jgi:hypothetical protein
MVRQKYRGHGEIDPIDPEGTSTGCARSRQRKTSVGAADLGKTGWIARLGVYGSQQLTGPNNH